MTARRTTACSAHPVVSVAHASQNERSKPSAATISVVHTDGTGAATSDHSMKRRSTRAIAVVTTASATNQAVTTGPPAIPAALVAETNATALTSIKPQAGCVPATRTRAAITIATATPSATRSATRDVVS